MAFNGLDRRTLLELRGDTKQRLIALQLSKTDTGKETEVANLILELKDEINQVDKQLVELSKEGNEKSSLNTSVEDFGTEAQLSRIISGLRHRIEAIGPFKVSKPIHEWLDRLTNVYKQLVTPNLTSHPSLEQEFCSDVVLNLPLGGQSKFADVSKWETLKSELKSLYQPDHSIFQLLSQVWNLELTGVKWNEMASRLTTTLAESKTSINAKYQKDGKSLDADQVFGLIGAMLMSESVRENSPETYRMMLDSLDRCKNAEDVAKKASFYSDRLLGVESQAFRVNRTAVGSQRRSKPKGKEDDKSSKDPDHKALVKACVKQRLCIKFNLGEPCDESSCKYKHEKLSAGQHTTYQTCVTQMNEIFHEDWSTDPFPEGN